jgi:Leucine-rich repeat (LRR) protein
MSTALNAHIPSYSPFTSLKILSLKNAGITTEEVRHLSPILVNLEELTLSSNRLKDADIFLDEHSSFQQLKLIQLEENEIDSWENVIKLSKLPRYY